MSAPVLAIGLDALAPELLENWTGQGKLPTLAKLMQQGLYARQRNFGLYRTENSWLTLLHGCSPETSHEWGHQDYEQGSYSFNERAAYEFKRYAPFYSLREKKQVAVFDVPLTGLVDGVKGVQLLGWGTEVNQILRESSPPDLMEKIIDRHGRHPLYDTITNADDGSETLSYRIPCLYDTEALRQVRDKLIKAAHQRTAIIRELMREQRWDLLVAVYAEIHTAGHLFWHLSQPHPLREQLQPLAGTDFLLEVLEAIDAGLALLVDTMPADSDLLVFSPHGMQGNSIDLCSMLFLPELLYRWSTGRAAFTGRASGDATPAPRFDFRRHWAKEVWDLRSAHGDAILESPAEQEARQDPLDWDPGNWYRRAWPEMRAFCIPGYSEGLIRINVAGRDGPDGIDPAEFDTVCRELERLIAEIVDPRSGRAVARKVVRVRTAPWENQTDKSPADLMVLWHDDLLIDSVEHPHHGQIGPVPYFRSGSHATDGFVIAGGSRFTPGSRPAEVSTPDLTATILSGLGVPIPSHVQGRPIGL